LFGSPKAFVDVLAPKAFEKAEEQKRSSLQPTLFEQLYGQGAENLLQDVLDYPEVFTDEENTLAWEILGGTKKLKTLNVNERSMLDHITDRLVDGGYRKPKPIPIRERNPEDDEGPPTGEDHEAAMTGQLEPAES